MLLFSRSISSSRPFGSSTTTAVAASTSKVTCKKGPANHFCIAMVTFEERGVAIKDVVKMLY